MPRRALWINPTNVARHLSDNDEKRTQIYRTIDRNGFDWQVFFVAASGFFTDSYNLFATNIILPSIAYVYWPNDQNTNWETAINCATLAGSAIGQLLFGYLADRYGRRKLYGLELIIVIVSTLGITQASQGYFSNSSGRRAMYIQAWLLCYRLIQGIGIGGEYPMSAVITAEFASSRSRARMMASVFLMQPLGTLAAALVGLAVVYGYSSRYPQAFGPEMRTDTASLIETKIVVDTIWRWVIGVGAIPAFVAILFRLTIPESPRYTLDVDMDAHRALQDTLHHYGSRSVTSVLTRQRRLSSEVTSQHSNEDPEDHSAHRQSFELDGVSPMGSAAGSMYDEPAPEPSPQEPGFFTGLYRYLKRDGNWRWLAGISMCWFLLDFAYYGLGINNPRTLAKVWASQTQQWPVINETTWDTNVVNGATILSGDGNNIFYVLRNGATRSIITTSIGAIMGSALLIQLIPYLPRKAALTWSFVVLFVLLLVTGTSLFGVFETDLHAVTITLYVLIQLVFNLGPNTLVFIVAAELFPTKYRGTCYGIASASGKLSAVIVQAVLPFATFGTDKNFHNVNDRWSLGAILIIWGSLMLLGGFFSWFWLPELQKPRCEGLEKGYRIPSKTLEELAEGRKPPEATANGASNVIQRRRFWSRNKEWDGRPAEDEVSS